MNDRLSAWEKLPIIGLFAAQGLYVWLWYTQFVAWPQIVALAGLAAVVAIDGAMVATVAGMRQGRRSRASVAAIVVTAAFGALVALDLYGAIGLVSAWLHAGFALTIVCYLLHLAAPVRHEVTHAADDAADLRQQIDLVGALLEDVRQERDALVAELAQRDAMPDADVIRIGDEAWSVRKLAAHLDMAEATLRRRLRRSA